jgi:hypothetical protein
MRRWLMAWQPPRRLSEKTIELNFCAQYRPPQGERVFWIGLTQRDERSWGFDVHGGLSSGRAFVFQFKASSRVVTNPLVTSARKFELDHQQLLRLVSTAAGARGSVYYVLPNFGTRVELAGRGDDVVADSWLLDVADLSSMQRPTTVPWLHPVRPRASSRHLLYLTPPTALICSDPFEVRLYPGREAMWEGGLPLEALSRIRWPPDEPGRDELPAASWVERGFGARAPIAAILVRG